jgi:hypothetical protein
MTDTLLIVNLKRPKSESMLELTPLTTSIPTLLDTLREIDRGVRAYSSAEHAQDKSVPVIALTGVQMGSLELSFSSQADYASYATQFARDLGNQNWDSMPLDAFKASQGLYKVSRKLKADLSIETKDSFEKIIIFKDSPLPERKIGKVSGSLTLSGQIIQTGGAEPAIDFRLDRNQKILHGIKVDVQTAKYLALRLYTPVILKGDAIWNAQTWEIEEFLYRSIVEIEYQNPSLGLEATQALVGNTWLGIDPEKYVKEIRGGLD